MPLSKRSHMYKIPAIIGLFFGAVLLFAPLLRKKDAAFSIIPKTVAALKYGADSAQSFSGAYLAGSYAADQGSSEASAYFRRALSFRPQDKFAQRALLLSLIDDGNFTEAVRRANIIQEDSDSSIRPVVRLVLAANAFKAQDYARVQTIVKDKNSREARLWVFFTAWADYARGEKRKAIQSLQQERFSEWYSFLSLYNIALMQDLSNDDKQAAANFEKALNYKQLAEMAPETYEHLLYSYAGLICRTQGAKAALRQLDRIEDSANISGSLLQSLRADLQQEKTPRRLVNTASEGAAEFTYAIGSTFLRAGEDIYADIYLQTALFLRPDDASTLFRLGVLSAKMQQPEKLRAYFAQIPPHSPHYRDAELLLALNINQNFADKDDIDKKNDTQSLPELEKMIARSPEKTELQNVLANMYLQSEKYTDAIALLNSMIDENNPNERKNWSLFFQRGIAYERNKNWAKAEADFQKALQLNPQNADVLNYYGYSLTDRNLQLEKGLDMVRKAAELRPQDGAILDSLGWAYYKLGNYDKAVTTLEQAVQANPSESSINDHLGDVYWTIGKKLDAVFQWNHALTFKPEAKDENIIRKKLQHGLQTESDDTKIADAAKKTEN